MTSCAAGAASGRLRWSSPSCHLALWNDLEEKFSSPGDGDLVFAFDASPDSAFASIAVASRRPDGRAHVERIDSRPGTGWLVERLKELVTKYGPRYVLVDGKSPAATAVPDLESAGIPVRQLGANDASAMFATFVQSCNDRVLVHRDDPVLVQALAGGVRRSLGDAEAWSRRNSNTDITPLVAVSEALYIVLSEGEGSANIWNLDDVVAEMQQKNAADQIEVLPSGVRKIPLSMVRGRGPFRNYSGIGGKPDLSSCPVSPPSIGTPVHEVEST